MASASAQEPALLTHDNVDGKTDAPAERMQQLLEKITTYRREDYVKNERLVGAHPLFLDATYTPSFEDKSQNQHRQLEKLDVPGYDRIVGILSEYAEESPEWCEWTSETLQEDLSLPITSPPPCRLVQVFMIGVHLSPFVLTCYDDTSKEEEVRQYANQTASALKWRLLEFCHLDFLLLPCIATKNFDLAALKEEIMNMLEDLSECFGGATHLDDDMFHTMKEATTALAGLTSLPCLLDADETAEMRQEVMEREWRGLLSLLIEKLSKQQQQIKDRVSIKTLSLRPSKDGEFKASLAVIEAVKRLSLRNTFSLKSSVFNKKLPRCLHLLNTEMNKRYDVCLHLSTCKDGESPQEVLALNTHDDSKLQRAVSVRCELQLLIR
ncbi:uncharacterized protein [Littorina saxatilis]|uniref:uncharacterized protein n=1 Tax=Littorina saxatilis TaxID=31220 RepID=UPI0038B5B63A